MVALACRHIWRDGKITALLVGWNVDRFQWWLLLLLLLLLLLQMLSHWLEL